MNDEKLVALAFVRASVQHDEDTLRLLMTENPPSPLLVSALVTFAGGLLGGTLGERGALDALDRWAERVAAGEAW